MTSKTVAFVNGPLAGKVIAVPASSGAYQALEFDDVLPAPRRVEDGSWQWPALEARQVTYSFYQYGCSLPWAVPDWSTWPPAQHAFFWIGSCRGDPARHDVMAAMGLLGIGPPVPGESSPLHVRTLTAGELSCP